MGFFENKKKTEDDILRMERKDLIKKIMEEKKRESEIEYMMPETYEYKKNASGRHYNPNSQEYILFKNEEKYEKEPHTIYEKLCYHSGKIIRISPGEDTKKKIQKAINFSGMHSTPEGVVGGSIVAAIISFVLTLIVAIIMPAGIITKIILILFIPLVVAYMIFTHPFGYANKVRMKEGRELITALLYIVVYLRAVPNLENAVRFAAENVKGKMKSDLKRVLWKVQVGTHNSIDLALMEYLKEWSNYNKEFLEAMHLIKESMLESNNERREKMLDKAISVVLEGMDDKMKMYARNLETPVMVLHGLGILLPVMGMIVFPLISIFLASDMENIGLYLFLGYDIILPLIILYFIRYVLSTRPSTHSSVDVVKKSGGFEVKNTLKNIFTLKRIIFLFAIAGGMIFLVPGIKFMLATNLFENCIQGDGLGACEGDKDRLEHSMSTMIRSLLIIIGFAVIFIIYYKGKCYKSLEIRSRVVSIEQEFEESMFAMGNRLVSGIPIEYALEKTVEDTKELSISKLFEISLKNMNRLSMSFEDSLFDEKYGALKDYPSALIRTIMKSVSSSLQRGSKYAATSMLTIATYLKNMRTTQSKINDLLSSTVSSMKFQAYVLVPAISGVVIAVSDLMIRMLSGLSDTMSALTDNLPIGTGMSSVSIIDIKQAMPAELLQLVVGIYVVEILVLLGIFVTRIEVGIDEIKEADNIWKFVLAGTFSYIIILFIVMFMFAPLLEIARMG